MIEEWFSKLMLGSIVLVLAGIWRELLKIQWKITKANTILTAIESELKNLPSDDTTTERIKAAVTSLNDSTGNLADAVRENTPDVPSV